jgi:hypothetical protein
MEKKKRLFFTSLDIIIYAIFVFAIGIAVGLGFGRYKNQRFFFAEEKLKTIEAANKQFQENNVKIAADVKDKIEPLIALLRNRVMESNKTDEPPAHFTFTRAFTTAPDYIIGMSGIELSLLDSQTTVWKDEVKSTINNTGVFVESVDPLLDVHTYWVAVPGLGAK